MEGVEFDPSEEAGREEVERRIRLRHRAKIYGDRPPRTVLAPREGNPYRRPCVEILASWPCVATSRNKESGSNVCCS